MPQQLSKVLLIAGIALTASAQCSFQISEGSPCGPDYVGFPVATASFPSESAFNTFLSTVNEATVSSLFVTSYGCVKPNVAILEYQVSFWCSLAAYGGLKANCASAAATTAAALCGTQCQLAQTSVALVLGDDAGCPAVNDPTIANKRSTLITTIASGCSTFAAQGANCLQGTQNEVAQCGFLDAKIACSQPANAANPCCATFIGTPAPSTTPQPSSSTNLSSAILIGSVQPSSTGQGSNPNTEQNATSTTSTTSKGTNTSSNTGIIVGSAIGGICLLAGIGIALRNHSRRRDRDAFLQSYEKYFPHAPAPAYLDHNEMQSYNSRSLVKSGSGNDSSRVPRKLGQTITGHNLSFKDGASMNGFNTSNNGRSGNSRKSTSPELEKVGLGSNKGIKALQSNSANGVAKVVRVVHPYRAVLNDELTLVVGTDIIMIKEHDDGWADGSDPIIGTQGVFPVACVMSPEDAANKNLSRPDFRVSTRQSSIFSTRQSTRQSAFSTYSSTPSTPNGKQVYRIVHAYNPVLDDELTLVPGNDIIVHEEFDDGWAKGMEPVSGKVGLFPMACVANANDNSGRQSNYSKYSSVYSKRTSSISKLGYSPSRIVTASPTPETLERPRPVLTVLHPYIALEPDELTLTVGGSIFLVEEFDDGWAEGRDMATGKVGIFPMPCVQKSYTGESGSANSAKRPESFSKRRSSIKQFRTSLAATRSEKRLRIHHQYNAQQPDELTLNDGKEVILLKEFNDGWARGKDPDTGKVGVFPMICVT